MMLRVVLFEIYRRFRLRLAPGAKVTKNTVVTTKPAAVPIVRLPRQPDVRERMPAALRERPATPHRTIGRDWGKPTEIPQTSAYRHLLIAYGSNFGSNKQLAERFAERSRFHGYTNEVLTLNELAQSPPEAAEPWLLVVMTSTYTSNPPSNATVFKSWLEQTHAGTELWRNCRYAVWGLGNTQWNAFLAFPRYVQRKLSELGAEPIAEFAYGDVGSPVWEGVHQEWNRSVWPLLLDLSGAQATEAEAARVAAETAAVDALTRPDSNTAMETSLARGDSAPGVPLVPKIMTNTVGVTTVEARVRACRELQAPWSTRRTRHVVVELPPGTVYKAGDHLGVCPKNDEELVERLARRLGAALDGLFMVPETLNVPAVPKGAVLQVRNTLTNLVDISGRPTAELLDLLLSKVVDPVEQSLLVEIRAVLQTPDGPDSPLRRTIRAGGYDVLQLLNDFPSCSLNIFEFLQVAQPLRPRYYSPSSSPRIHGDGVAHLTVGLSRTPVPDMPGREFCGMSSHYLHTLRERDRVNVFVQSADGFHMQDDVDKPMVFVSVGTGFAPMRAFLWERVALKRDGVLLAEAALFNGIRSSGLDYIYRDEIESFAAEGVLDHVHVATSREDPRRRVYVQDLLRDQGALVWRLLVAGGYVYVCGSQPMRDNVFEAFVDVVSKHGSRSHEDAEAYMRELETAKDRYRPDLWG